MYMHRNVTDKFIGTVVSCDIISTGSWYGDLPDSVPKEVKLNRKDYYIEEIQHISIKETISVTYGIKWEHISKPVEGKIESLTTKEYSIDESKKQYLLELMGRRFSDDIDLYDEDECAVQVQLINTEDQEFIYEFPFDNTLRAMSILSFSRFPSNKSNVDIPRICLNSIDMALRVLSKGNSYINS